MNFVGHARVASFLREDPAFLVGAMLPDFARMAGTRIRQVDDPDLAAGVKNHHAADEVFHAQPTFIELQIATRKALTARGVPRPPALAVGHIGVELLLDGALLKDPGLANLYEGSIGEAGRAADRVTWRGTDGRDSYARLCDRLCDRGAPHVYRDPEVVAQIMERILRRSDVLRMDPTHIGDVAMVLEEMLPEVHDAADVLVAAVRDGLEPTSIPA